MVGGDFINAGGSTASHIASWDGASWTKLGSGTDSSVLALAEHGDVLYAGGEFTHAGSVPAAYMAAWDGTSWSTVGLGMNGAEELADGVPGRVTLRAAAVLSSALSLAKACSIGFKSAL
jgi:hypothetical protein